MFHVEQHHDIHKRKLTVKNLKKGINLLFINIQ